MLLIGKSLAAMVLVVGALAPLVAALERRPATLAASAARGVTGRAPRRLPAVAAVEREAMQPAASAAAPWRLVALGAWLPVLGLGALLPWSGEYAWVGWGTSLATSAPRAGLLVAVLLGALGVAWWSTAVAQRREAGEEDPIAHALVLASTFSLVLGSSLVGLALVFGTWQLAALPVQQDAMVPLSSLAQVFGEAPAQGLQRPGLAVPRWGLFLQPGGFALCLVSLLAVRAAVSPRPGIAPGGEVGAGGCEWSSWRLRSSALVVTSALLATCFLGGWALPGASTVAIVNTLSQWLGEAGATLCCMALHVAAFVAKTLGVAWLLLRLERSLSPVRVERVLRFYWQLLLPLSLVNTLATAFALAALERGPA